MPHPYAVFQLLMLVDVIEFATWARKTGSVSFVIPVAIVQLLFALKSKAVPLMVNVLIFGTPLAVYNGSVSEVK